MGQNNHRPGGVTSSSLWFIHGYFFLTILQTFVQWENRKHDQIYSISRGAGETCQSFNIFCKQDGEISSVDRRQASLFCINYKNEVVPDSRGPRNNCWTHTEQPAAWMNSSSFFFHNRRGHFHESVTPPPKGNAFNSLLGPFRVHTPSSAGRQAHPHIFFSPLTCSGSFTCNKTGA